MDRGPVIGVVAHEYVVPKPFGTLPVTGSGGDLDPHPDLAWCEDLNDPTGPALFGWLRNVARTSAE